MDLEEGKSGEIETGRLKNWTDKVQNYQVDECRAMDVEEGGRNDENQREDGNCVVEEEAEEKHRNAEEAVAEVWMEEDNEKSVIIVVGNNGDEEKEQKTDMVMDPMKDEPGIETHLAVVQSVQSGQKNKRKQSKKAEKEHFHSKRKIKSYVNDFTDYLPPLLIAVNKVPTLPSIRLGSRYQAVVPSQPNFRFVNRSLHELKIWNGSSDSSSHPLQEHINKFKEIFGCNRTEEDLIHLYLRSAVSWEELMDLIVKDKVELRKRFIKDRARS